MCLKCYSYTLSDHLYRMCYVPVNVRPHYTLYRQMAGITGTLAERGCPYSQALITSEDRQYGLCILC